LGLDPERRADAGDLELVVGHRRIGRAAEPVADREQAHAAEQLAISRRAQIHPRRHRTPELARGVEREVTRRLQRQRRLHLRGDIARDDAEPVRREMQLVPVEQVAA
jgi:hypothetical protein